MLLSHNVTCIRKSTNTMLIGHWELPNARYISVNPVAFAADTLKATWWLIIDHYWSIGGCALTIKHDFPLLGPRIPYVNRIRRKKTQYQPAFELIVTSQLLDDLIKESRLQITSSIKYMERVGNETPNLGLPSIVDFCLYKFFFQLCLWDDRL